MSGRRAMTPARKRRIHEREGGLCWHCKELAPMFGPDVRYDHFNVLWITGDDTDEAIKPAHTTCDAPKTAADLKTIGKIKRLIKNADPATRKQPRMKSRANPWPPKGEGKPIQARGFDKSKSRRLDGTAVTR
jgi:5-methylcytosine-specific restriction protein A